MRIGGVFRRISVIGCISVFLVTEFSVVLRQVHAFDMTVILIM